MGRRRRRERGIRSWRSRGRIRKIMIRGRRRLGRRRWGRRRRRKWGRRR